jgi:hypothetical protein
MPIDWSGQTWCFVQSELLRFKPVRRNARRVFALKRGVRIVGRDSQAYCAERGRLRCANPPLDYATVENKIELRLTGPVNYGALFKVNGRA